jgi:DUF2075 family protein
MITDRRTHGWSGSIEEFLHAPKSVIEEKLNEHLRGLLNMNAGGSQIEAWFEEIDILQSTFRALAISEPKSIKWSIILEYELPLEGGRRPDAIVLGPGKIFVLEFKKGQKVSKVALDQVAAYARDLSEYHSETHGIEVLPFLIPTGQSNLHTNEDEVKIVSPDLLATTLNTLYSDEKIELTTWLDGEYAPLPTLIAAAKMIFFHKNLPSIRRAESAGVHEAVKKLSQISEQSRIDKSRNLAFVSGVPGAGKTLVGLQFVYDQSSDDAKSVFLSGNGPLVEVLRDALKSKTFVSDLHAFIKSYGTTTKIPNQHIIVFDEAQRAWDADHMRNKKAIANSEPELLINIGERLPEWTTLVGLIGYGQEINTGEEGGIQGWVDALRSEMSKMTWTVFVPSRFAPYFESEKYEIADELDLNITLRTKQAEDLHDWVRNLLDGNIAGAAQTAKSLRNYPILVTRELEKAKDYVKQRYFGEETKRYGIIASSKDRILEKYGIHNGFQATKLVKYSKWYNNKLGEVGSCCNFEECVTEFGCQGLELDMAILAWGNDYKWNGTTWEMRKFRTQFPQKNPQQLRENSYRVLLTRSRDGLVIFIPPEKDLDPTEHILLAAGAEILVGELPLASSL